MPQRKSQQNKQGRIQELADGGEKSRATRWMNTLAYYFLQKYRINGRFARGMRMSWSRVHVAQSYDRRFDPNKGRCHAS